MNPLQSVRGKQGASILGATNPARDGESPSRLVPPQTDHGKLLSLKWSFADSHNWLAVRGHVNRTLSLSLDDILALPQVELAAVNQCSGNSRGYF